MELSRPAVDIGLVVEDLDAALAFYRDTLGLPVVREMTTPGIGHYTFLQVGHSLLKLIVREKAIEAKAAPGGLGANVSGLRYVTYPVTDVAAIVEKAVAAGYKTAVPLREFGDIKVAILEDPEGNWVDLMQEPTA